MHFRYRGMTHIALAVVAVVAIATTFLTSDSVFGAASVTQIKVADVTANPGTTGVEIPIDITGMASPGLAAFNFTVTFNSSVFTATNAIQDSDTDTGWSLFVNTGTAGQIAVSGFKLSSPPSGNFKILKIIGNAANTPGASTTMALTVTSFKDNDNLDVDTSGKAANGSLTIPTLPTFSVSPTTLSVSEGAGNASLTVTLDPTSGTDQTVTVNTIAGTATAGADYTALSGSSQTVTIPANTANATVTVPILQDTLDEADETFQVSLSNPSSGTLLSTTAATSTVTITDDDANPTLAVDIVSVTQAEGNATNTIVFKAKLSTASGQPVTVSYATQNGTATGGSDFTAKSGTLSFSPGVTVATTSIQVLGDTTYEGDETFSVVLSNGATTKATEAITITLATTTITLQNDDTPVAKADSYSATEDTVLTVGTTTGLLANDPNFFARTVDTTPVVAPTKGTVVLSANGSFVYTPNANVNGTDTFQYKYNDGRFDSNSATATISIAAVNDAPVAVADFYAVVPGQVLNINAASGLLANDTDVDTGDSKTFVSNTPLDPVAAGTVLTVSADGSFSYNPGSFVGTQTFTYTMKDAGGLTSTATVTLSQGPTFKMKVLSTQPIDEDASGASVSVKITLINGTTTAASTVLFSSAVGTTSPSQVAADSSDFTVSSRTVTLDTITTSTTIQVPIINDLPAIREGLEYFVVQLSNPGSSDGSHTPVISGSVGGVTKLPVSIDDPQDIPKLSIADVTLVEGTGAAKSSSMGKVTVTLTGRTKFSTEFFYQVTSTSTAPAAGPNDFQVVTSGGPLTIGPNTSADSTTTQIMVTIFDDAIDELNEIFVVRMSGPSEKSGAKASVGFTDNEAVVTIEDDDNPPSIQILPPADALESSSSATVSVKLIGASGAGVKVNFATSDGTATAGSDYTAANGTLTWGVDQTGIRTFTVTIKDDALEEDGETVTLTLSNATTTVSGLGVTIASSTTGLLILDDEPAAAIVTIMSDGEAMPGDGYFLIVAGSDSPALGLSGLSSAQLVSPMNQTLMPISKVTEVVRKMLGLDKLRSKAVTHAWYAVAATSTGQQKVQYNVKLTYGSKTHNVNATLNMVTARTNRNVWIQDGVNFAGLGLVPNDPSITNLLKQPVNNANPALSKALKRQVTLADVIQSIFAFSFTNNAFFSSYNTADPITGADAADTLTQLKPFQGMVIKSRDSVTPTSGPSINVFETVVVNGASTTVPVKINLQGPYLATVGNNPPFPVTQQLRTGFNLIAPHVWAPTPFNTAFVGSSAGLDLATIYGPATSLQKAVFPVSMPGPMVGALVVKQFVTPSAAPVGSGQGGIIDPALSYWLQVLLPSGATQPVVTASGPNSGEQP